MRILFFALFCLTSQLGYAGMWNMGSRTSEAQTGPQIEIKSEKPKASLPDNVVMDIYDDHRYEVVEVLLEDADRTLRDAVVLWVKRNPNYKEKEAEEEAKEKAKKKAEEEAVAKSDETAEPEYADVEYREARRKVTRYSGPGWTWPGSLRQHLSSTHGIDTSGLSQAELKTIHDNLHNTGSSGISGGSRRAKTTRYSRPAVRIYRQSTYRQPVRYASGSCPSGVCPSY